VSQAGHDLQPAIDLLDALPLAVVLVDGTGAISGWNASAEVLYGHTTAEVIGRRAADLLFDDDDRADATALLARVAGGDRWEGDFRVRRSDGMLLVSSFRAHPMSDASGVVWIATDGMDQGLAEQERSVLLSAEHAARATAEEALGLVEAIITSAPVGMAVFDLDLRYVRVNDAFAALSGVAAEAHVGGRIGEVVPLPPQVGADLRRVVTTGRTILGRQVEVDDWGRPPVRRHLSVSYYPVRSTTGTLVGAGATVVDITETKRAEVERAALLRQAESAQQRLAILATASTVLTTTMELDELLTRLARVLTPGVADWCIIQLLGADGVVENVTVSHRDVGRSAELAAFLRAHPIALNGAGPVAEVLRTGVARVMRADDIVDAVQRAADDRGSPELAGDFSLRSSVVVPIDAHGTVLGALLLSTEGERDLDDDDLDLAVEVAHRAALALENARAFQQEHQIAESLQRAMLPVTVPIVPGIDLAVRYVAATDGASVGGDWYDVIAFDDDDIGLVVGDVVGHDIAASATMGQLRSALLAYACEEHGHPSAALARIDRVFDTLGLTYATCIFAVLDRAGRMLRWSNAGHPPPLLRRAGETTFLTDGAGVLLGVTAGSELGEAEEQLHDGDLIVLYTDGLVERRGESLDEGLDRLARAVARIHTDDAEAISDAILAEMLPPSASRADDVALLVARVTPSVDAAVAHRLELDRAAESAVAARGFTAGVLEHAGWGTHVDTATLLVSELVTNAVRHGQAPCALSISFGDGEVEITVEDGDPTMPERRHRDEMAEDGRGFVLVDALAADWGTRPVEGGKATWFILRTEVR
jgi:PAS domain S-box-containing protein